LLSFEWFVVAHLLCTAKDCLFIGNPLGCWLPRLAYRRMRQSQVFYF
jgi:hypothetical protein